MTQAPPRFRTDQRVTMAGRSYRIISVTRGLIGGPHYRLAATPLDDERYPDEDLTAECLMSPVVTPGLEAGQ